MARQIVRRLAPVFLIALLVGPHVTSASAKKLLGLRGLKQASLSDSESTELGSSPTRTPGGPGEENEPHIEPIAGAGTYSLQPSQPMVISGRPNAPPVYPGYGGHDSPPYPQYPSPSHSPDSRSPWQQVLDLVEGLGYDLGLYKVVSFVKDVLPAVSRVLEDAPVAILYLQRVFKYGVPSAFKVTPGVYGAYGQQPGTDSKITAALHGILQPTIRDAIATDTGSLVAERVLMEQGLDLSTVASSTSWASLVPQLYTGIWNDLGDDYGPATAVLTTLNVFKGMAVYILSPYARVSGTQVALDVVATSLSLVTNVVGNAETLRYELDAEMSMRPDEWDAFTRLKDNLESIRGSLASLDTNLRA